MIRVLLQVIKLNIEIMKNNVESLQSLGIGIGDLSWDLNKGDLITCN